MAEGASSCRSGARRSRSDWRLGADRVGSGVTSSTAGAEREPRSGGQFASRCPSRRRSGLLRRPAMADAGGDKVDDACAHQRRLRLAVRRPIQGLRATMPAPPVADEPLFESRTPSASTSRSPSAGRRTISATMPIVGGARRISSRPASSSVRRQVFRDVSGHVPFCGGAAHGTQHLRSLTLLPPWHDSPDRRPSASGLALSPCSSRCLVGAGPARRRPSCAGRAAGVRRDALERGAAERLILDKGGIPFTAGRAHTSSPARKCRRAERLAAVGVTLALAGPRAPARTSSHERLGEGKAPQRLAIDG